MGATEAREQVEEEEEGGKELKLELELELELEACGSVPTRLSAKSWSPR